MDLGQVLLEEQWQIICFQWRLLISGIMRIINIIGWMIIRMEAEQVC